MEDLANMLSLIGQYDSPFVRRVAVSLTVLEIPFERQSLSVFQDAAALSGLNPLGRVPALLIEEGECLIDSAAILDYLDERVGHGRALLPAAGAARRDALKTIALATGACDKTVATLYERRRPASKIEQDWIGRYRRQLEGALAELDRRSAAQARPVDKLLQPVISVAVMLGFVRLYLADAAPVGRYPALDRLAAWAEAQPAFVACRPSVAELAGLPEEARAALLRLQGGA
jgi:glutathione S-transferase